MPYGVKVEVELKWAHKLELHGHRGEEAQRHVSARHERYALIPLLESCHAAVQVGVRPNAK